DCRIRAETPLPQSVTQQDDSLGAGAVFISREVSAKRRGDSEHFECVIGYSRTQQVFGLIAPCECRTPTQKPGDVFERLRVLAPVTQVGGRCPLALGAAALLMILPDHHEPAWIAIRKRAK